MNLTGIQSLQLSATDRTNAHSLRVALCPPDLYNFTKVMNGEAVDATFIIQTYIAKGLRDRGHQLTVLGAYTPDDALYAGELESLEPAHFTWSSSRWFVLANKVVWRIQRLLGIPYLNVFSNLRLMDACMQYFPGKDLVYERNSMHKFGVAMACKRLGMPYILYVEADDILEHDIMKKPIKGLQRLQVGLSMKYNLQAADKVICVSEPLKAHLIKQWKVAAKKIEVFPNVADIRRFHPEAGGSHTVRHSLGIGQAPLIIFVGNFYEWHDVATLLRAFSNLLDTSPHARLLLVGDGEKRHSMAQLASELGIDHAVTFTGMVAHADVPQYMAAADIAVVPYPSLNQEIWLSPLKLFEYMATGNAIIASDVGQLHEWIMEEQNGLLVPPGDVPALAMSLKRLVDDPALRLRLGQKAREEAVKRHSWDRYLSDLEALCLDVALKGKQ